MKELYADKIPNSGEDDFGGGENLSYCDSQLSQISKDAHIPYGFGRIGYYVPPHFDWSKTILH